VGCSGSTMRRRRSQPRRNVFQTAKRLQRLPSTTLGPLIGPSLDAIRESFSDFRFQRVVGLASSFA